MQLYDCGDYQRFLNVERGHSKKRYLCQMSNRASWQRLGVKSCSFLQNEAIIIERDMLEGAFASERLRYVVWLRE